MSTDEKAKLVLELGAERAIRYRDEDVLAAIRQWTGKSGADVVFDTVGRATFLACFDQVASYGTLSATMSEWPPGVNSLPQFLNLRIVLANMGLLFDQQALKVVVAARFPLADARDAHEALESGTVMGRLVLEMPA